MHAGEYHVCFLETEKRYVIGKFHFHCFDKHTRNGTKLKSSKSLCKTPGRTVERKRESQGDRTMGLVKPFIILFAGLLARSNSYEIRPSGTQQAPTKETSSRRSFLATTAATTLASTTTFAGPAHSADIKVTPLAHTFITASGASKPIRENDATRFFTNAKVVYLFEGGNADSSLAGEVLDLTAKRKAGQGPGVTPGNVKLFSSSKDLGSAASSMGLDVVSRVDNIGTVVEGAKSLPSGDVLLVGPVPSGGTAADGKTLADTTAALGISVGGKTGGGVISVLLDGPREGLKLEEGGYQTSELLWYSLPKK